MDSQIFFFNIWRFKCLLRCECRRAALMAYGLAPRQRMDSCHHYMVLYDIFVNRGLSPTAVLFHRYAVPYGICFKLSALSF